jgi:Fur family ferric uptake transcriptional regulator
MRVTPQREMILTVLHDLPDHESVEEIHRRVRELSSAVDISTVYRTLELLDGMKMLAVVESPDGQRRYALLHSHQQHAHLVCSECGAVMEVDPYPVRDLERSLRQLYGFALAVDHVTLTGRCAACCAN